MPSKPTPDRFLSFKDVAELIGLAVKTVRNGECGTNEIPRIKLGSRVLFSFNAVQRWMALKAREAEEDKQREKMAVIDLMAQQRREKQMVRDIAQQIANEERRRRGR